MTSWADNFDRADGPVGSDWAVQSGTWAIATNKLRCSASGAIRPTHAAPTDGLDIYFDVFGASNAGSQLAFMVGLNEGAGTFYQLGFDPSGGSWTRTVYKVVGGVYTLLWNAGTGVIPHDGQTYHITYDAGAIRLYVDDVLTFTADNTDLTMGTGFQVYAAGETWDFDNFSIGDPIVRSLEVTPDPLWVGGGQQLLTLTGTNTEWTPGEPGSTTITADHGTIDLQRVVSETVAEAWYTPAEYIGTITFTESEYGLSDEVNGVAVMPEGYGETECRLTPQGAALINDTADDTPLTYRLWRRDTPVGTTPIDYTLAETYKSLADFLINNGWLGNQNNPVDLSIILRALNGGYEPAAGPYPEPTYRVLTDFLAALAQQITDVQGPGGVTIATLAAALSDLRGVGSPSIKDVLDAVGNVNNDDVMTYLQALRGNDVVNLLQVVTALTNIQTLNGYDLGTIVQRLDDRPTTLYMDAAFALTNGALGGLALEIAGLYKALGVVEATNIFDVISGILGDLFSGLGQEVVDQFLDSIFGPDTPLPQIVLVPPIWPGLSRANVGNAVALQNGQTIAGPLHGLLFTIDQQPTEKYAYHFGNVRSWGRVGAVIFATDRGDYERSQTFALDTQVLCPQQMAVADHAIIKVNSGWGGTVRPWTIAQPQSP